MEPNKTTSTFVQDLVVFDLNAQRYALPVKHIVQIIEMVTLTAVPQINPVVVGLINVRGTSVPVLDMRRYLKLPDKALHLHTPIILVRVSSKTGEQLLGLIVDEVVDVAQILSSHITPLPHILPETLRHAPFVHGIAHTEYGMVILLDLAHLFSPDMLEQDPTLEEDATLSSAMLSEQLAQSPAQYTMEADL